MSIMSVFDIAGSGMNAQIVRLNTVVSNLSNAESVAPSEAEAYRAKVPIFSATQGDFDNAFSDAKTSVQVIGIYESQEKIGRIFQPEHPYADKDGYVFTSNVSSIQEMVNMVSASRTYQTNVEVFNTAKKMMLQTINLGK